MAVIDGFSFHSSKIYEQNISMAADEFVLSTKFRVRATNKCENYREQNYRQSITDSERLPTLSNLLRDIS